jgi:RNA polymerase sigma-70 factor (ECF subfamily)
VSNTDRKQEQPSDSELMEKLKMGDLQAIDPLYRRYRGVVCGVLHGQAGGLSVAEVEDLCHDVFLTLIDIAKRFRAGDTLKGWLCGIAIRKARRLREGGWLRQTLLGRFGGSVPETVSGEAVEHKLDTERMLALLPPNLREVVVLSLVEQLSTEDVATALGLNTTTVRTRLFRARALLRQRTEAQKT